MGIWITLIFLSDTVPLPLSKYASFQLASLISLIGFFFWDHHCLKPSGLLLHYIEKPVGRVGLSNVLEWQLKQWCKRQRKTFCCICCFYWCKKLYSRCIQSIPHHIITLVLKDILTSCLCFLYCSLRSVLDSKHFRQRCWLLLNILADIKSNLRVRYFVC